MVLAGALVLEIECEPSVGIVFERHPATHGKAVEAVRVARPASIISSARASSAGGTASQHPDPMKTLSVFLDRLDQMLRVRIRQNFRIQAGQCGFERLPVDFCDSHA